MPNVPIQVYDKAGVDAALAEKANAADITRIDNELATKLTAATVHNFAGMSVINDTGSYTNKYPISAATLRSYTHVIITFYLSDASTGSKRLFSVMAPTAIIVDNNISVQEAITFVDILSTNYIMLGVAQVYYETAAQKLGVSVYATYSNNMGNPQFEDCYIVGIYGVK